MKTLSEVLKQQYGRKLRKLALSSGCTCPNRDGTKGTGGCTFCSLGGSGEFASAFAPVDVQIQKAKELLKEPQASDGYIAYFQSFTNTYGDPDRLAALFEETLRRPDIEILSVATRPDCLSSGMIERLRTLSELKPVWVELGLQTIHESTAERIHRCYELPVFEDAVRRLKAAGIPVIVHMIFSLPGESREDMLDGIRWLCDFRPGIDGIKITMLQILKGTKLAEEYLAEPFPLLTMDEYSRLTAESLRILPDRIVVHRLTGDPPRSLLIAPEWTTHKKKTRNMIMKYLKEY